MPISYINVRSSFTAVATQSPVVDAPAGILDDDLILIFLVTNTATNVSAPAGWSQAGTEIDIGGTDATTALIYKIASGEGASWTLTNIFPVNSFALSVAIVYRSVDTVTPIHKVDQAAAVAATSLSGPSVTPTLDNCMIVQFGGCDPGASAYSMTPDASPVATERFDSKIDGNNFYAFIQEYLQAAAAAIALDATALTSDDYGYHQIAIAPSAPAAGGYINQHYVSRLPKLRANL